MHYLPFFSSCAFSYSPSLYILRVLLLFDTPKLCSSLPPRAVVLYKRTVWRKQLFRGNVVWWSVWRFRYTVEWVLTPSNTSLPLGALPPNRILSLKLSTQGKWYRGGVNNQEWYPKRDLAWKQLLRQGWQECWAEQCSFSLSPPVEIGTWLWIARRCLSWSKDLLLWPSRRWGFVLAVRGCRGGSAFSPFAPSFRS